MSILRRIRRFAPVAVLFGMCAWGAVASADMLPLVVDQTGGANALYWWSTSAPRYEGAIAGQLFGPTVRGIVRPDAVPDFAVSRIFQRPDISVANARQLAMMSGANTFFLGVATSDTHVISWVDSVAAEVRIRGGLYDTRSGVLLREAQLVGRGVSNTVQGAMALAARSASADLANFQSADGLPAVNDEQLQVLLRVDDGAEAYVKVRDALSMALQRRADISECRASEGEIVLCVHSMPGQSPEHVRATVLAALRAPIELVVIDELLEDGSRLRVRAHAQRPSLFGDATTLPR